MGSFTSIVDSSLEIQDRAAPEKNGGLIGYLLDYYKNNGSISDSTIFTHFEDSISSGGFVAALVFAAIFIVILFILVISVLVIHFARRKFLTPAKISKATNRKVNNIRTKIPNTRTLAIVQFVFIIIFVILTFSFLICSFVASSSLDDNLTADDSDNNKSNQNGLLPSLRGALNDVTEYVSTFTEALKENSAPILDSIIKEADKLVGGSLKAFVESFMESVGVKEFFKHANSLNDNLGAVIKSMEHVEPLFTKVNDGINKVRFQYSDYVQKFNDALKDCPDGFKVRCQTVINMLNQPSSGTVDMTNVNIKAVISLIYLMEAKNVTADMLSKELLNGQKQVDDMIQGIYKKFDEDVNITAMITEMTDSLFNEMNSTISNSVAQFSTFSFDVAKDTTKNVEVTRYTLTTIALVLSLLSLCFCLGVCIYCYIIIEDKEGFGYKVMPTKYRHILKLVSCLLLLFFVLNIMVMTLTFIFGGYLRTEVCRYVEPKEKSGLAIVDNHINELIDAKWPLLEQLLNSSNISLPIAIPKPFNVLQGIVSECAANKSVLEALHIKNQIDPNVLAEIDAFSGLLGPGKVMMHKAIGEIDASAMFPEDIDSLISEARQIADLFMDKVDYQTSVNELGKPILNLGAQEVLPAIFALANDIQATDSYKSFVLNYVGNDLKTTLDKVPELDEQKALLQKYFATIQKFKYVDSTIIQLQTSLEKLKETMLNNATLKDIADEGFDKHIANNIITNAKDIISASVKDLMEVIGPCGLIFNAYSKVVDSSCSAVLSGLNILWFCMAFCTGFFLPLVLLMFIVTTKFSLDGGVDTDGPKKDPTVIENPGALDTSDCPIISNGHPKPALKYTIGINNNPDYFTDNDRNRDDVSYNSFHSSHSVTTV